LRREAERVKRSLSTSHQETIEIDAFCRGSDLKEALSRAKFEELNMDLFKKTLGPIQKVMVAQICIFCSMYVGHARDIDILARRCWTIVA
jgi:hypothetical protein